MNAPLSNSQGYCARVSRQASSNFYWAFWLLPAAQRQAMFALYAFSRQADDLSDSHESMAVRQTQLEIYRNALTTCLTQGRPDRHWPALRAAVERYHIPHSCLYAILDGVSMDLQPPDFADFETLRNYCQHVASAVGFACIRIWGCTDPLADAACDASGIAFQLTNILRDVGEDLERKRIYLPRTELAQFDLKVEDLNHSLVDHRWRALIRFQVQRAEQFYEEAATLAALLPSPGRRAYRLMFDFYFRLLMQIKQCDGDLFHHRLRLATPAKLRIVGKLLRSELTSYLTLLRQRENSI